MKFLADENFPMSSMKLLRNLGFDIAHVGIYENDIATLLNAYQPPLAPLFEELAPHVNETDLAAIHEVVDDIRRRIDRFGKNFTETKS